MAYVVLARKYRPTTFAEVVGQDHIVRTLGSAIAQNRVHHAFLLTGARGVGKTSTARLLARALNCSAGPTITPCNSCAPCREILAGQGTDVLEIDGASHTGVDNVRELREAARYLPAHGRHKIYIIDEVHMLSTAAFNALLKTLEEPPAHVKFIFATTEPQKIPVTILSRCQRFDFRRVGGTRLQQHLESILAREAVSLPMAVLAAIVREAQGSVRDALSLLDQALSIAATTPDEHAILDALGIIHRRVIFALMDAIVARQAAPLLRQVEAVDQRGHDLTTVARLLAEHIRDVAVQQHLGPGAAADEEMGAVLQAHAVGRSGDDLQRLFAEVMQVTADVGISSLPRISLEMGLLRLLELEPGVAVASLLERLERLIAGEGGGVDGGGGGSGGGLVAAAAPGLVGERARGGSGRRVVGGEVDAEAAAETAVVGGLGTDVADRAVGLGAAARVGSGSDVAGKPGDKRVSAGSVEENGGGGPSADAVRRSAAGGVGAAGAAGEVVGMEVAAAAAAAEHAAVDWPQIIAQLRRLRPAVASVLEHGHLLAFSAAGVRLAYRPSTFYWEAARDADNQSLLTGLLAEIFGQPVPVAIVPLPSDGSVLPPTLAQLGQQRQVAFEADVRAGALKHEVVRNVMQILGGEVTQVKPLANNGTHSGA